MRGSSSLHPLTHPQDVRNFLGMFVLIDVTNESYAFKYHTTTLTNFNDRLEVNFIDRIFIVIFPTKMKHTQDQLVLRTKRHKLKQTKKIPQESVTQVRLFEVIFC